MKITTLPTLVLGTASLLMLSSCKDDSSADSNTSGGSSAGPGIGTTGGVELKTDLPKEVIEGSPKPKNVKNLMPEIKKFPTFLVPEGTVLLSQGKTVTSSDDFPILGEVSYLTDGEKEAGEGYFLEMVEGTQWAQIDLEKSNPLYAILIWHFHSEKRVYHDVIVQVSDDPEFKSGVTTLYNNDYDDSSGLGKGSDRPYIESRFGLLVNGKGTKGRYVRLYSRGSTSNEMNHYTEVEVFGKPE
ncbi:MAG: hypothetical protein KJO21_03790 [Verrucomicrobiae bacterium]|nr:hypothetical protein [Verrucomicrobiae bacterium]NNJ42621.1 hypothetical protein [Akkermansiaceae bacterium]